MNDFDRYPNLMTAALGLPPWAIHLRALNNINMLVAFGLALIVAFSQSFGAGLAYAGIFIAGKLVISGIGSVLASQGSMLMAIMIATVVLLALNGLLALHFFGIWSVLGNP